jgi:hypothetical protein
MDEMIDVLVRQRTFHDCHVRVIPGKIYYIARKSCKFQAWSVVRVLITIAKTFAWRKPGRQGCLRSQAQ